MKNFVEIKGINIAYVEEGEGDPVIVLHGWGASIEAVMSIVNILKSFRKVYALDGPGFGDSDDPKEVFSTYDYAEVVKDFMKIKGIDKADFIGHSFGGKTLIALSTTYPDLVKKLVLVDASGIIPKRKLSYYIKVYGFKLSKFLYTRLFFWKDRDELLEKFYKRHGSDDYKSAGGIMRQVFVKVVNEDLEPKLKDISKETLLIWGDSDDATPLYMGKIFEREIKNSGLVVLKGGHYSYADDYPTFKAVIESFLR